MDKEKLIQLMRGRGGWTPHSYSGDKSSFDFCLEEYPIHCQIYPGSNSFEFIYVTPGMIALNSGIMSGFDNNDHFNRRFSHFKRVADRLVYN
jgi:hypothetical protein